MTTLARLANRFLVRSLGALALALLAAVPAHAAPRQLYAVAVPVDETATNAVVARENALKSAPERAWPLLLQRLVLAEDLAQKGLPVLDAAGVRRFAAGVAVENERRSGTRYLATGVVNFDPTSVRTLLRQSGYRFVEARASTALLVPQIDGGTPAEAAGWSNAWRGQFTDELAPLEVSSTSIGGAPSWASAAVSAQLIAATQAVYVIARRAGAGWIADVVRVDAAGSATLGRTAIVPEVASIPATMGALALAANAIVQEDWKRQTLARALGGGVRTAINARYTSLGEWLQVRSAIQSSRLISEVRIDAIATDGAQLTIASVSPLEQLATDWAQRGLSLVVDPGTQAWTVRLAR